MRTFLILAATVLTGGVVGFVLGNTLGLVGMILSIPVGFTIGMIGAVIADE